MKGFFDYFQLAAVVLFLVILVGRTVQMRVLYGVRPFVLGIGRKGAGILEVAFFVGLSAWITEIFMSSLSAHARLFPSVLEQPIVDSTAVKVIGVVVVAGSLLLFVWALRSFGRSWRVGIDDRTAGDLITTGAFGFSRNPIFLFIDLYFVGTFLINGTIAFLIFAAAAVSGLHYQIVREEKHLLHSYGQAYADYCTKTGRYVTLFKRSV
jgi:protein-S-isoprenylcysteine O-methyltransferase Ste14